MKKYKFDVSNVESFVNDVRLNFTSDDLEEIQKVGKELNHCLNSMGQVGEVIVVKASDENPIGKTIVVMNESHGLMDEQKSILDRKYPNYEILSVPASGWTLQEIDGVADTIHEKLIEGGKETENAVIFVSPIPALIKACMMRAVSPDYMESIYYCYEILIFHNDNREKKELPNGKIIQVVAKTGWQLV